MKKSNGHVLGSHEEGKREDLFKNHRTLEATGQKEGTETLFLGVKLRGKPLGQILGLKSKVLSSRPSSPT